MNMIRWTYNSNKPLNFYLIFSELLQSIVRIDSAIQASIIIPKTSLYGNPFVCLFALGD